MTITTKIVSNSPRDTIVKFVGNGSATLSLASLCATNQVVSGAPVVNIISVLASLPGSASGTITRNSTPVFHMHDNFEFQTDGLITAVIDENNTYDITIDLSQDATLLVKLKKMYGYSGI